MKRFRQIACFLLVSGLSWAAPASAAFSLCGTSMSTGVDRSFNSAVILTCDAMVNDTAGGAIGFGSTVDGGFGLTTSTSGATSFFGAVGASTPLTYLTINAGTLSLGSTIHVSGNLSLTNASGDINQSAAFSANSLSGSSPNNVVLTNSGNLFFLFGNFSAKSLSLSNAVALTINGPITATGHPGSLAITSAGTLTVNPSAALAGSTVSLTGGNGIALSSNVTADTSLSLTASSGSISQLNGALTSSGACNVDAGSGTITFANNVSCATPAFTAATTNVNGALSVGAGSVTSVIGMVTGKYSQAGSLTLKAFATSSHKLAVSGSAALGGTLTVNFASVPGLGQNLTVLTAASISGKFANLVVSGLPSDRVAEITYTASSVVLTIRSAVTCFVKFDATGGNNGLSWVDAYTGLQPALSNPVCGQIWVARGVYKPTTTADRSIAFNIPPHARVYGGFAGTETLFAQREPAASLAVLSGDIDNNDSGTNGVDPDTGHIVGNNSFHVVVIDGTTAAGPVDLDTVLDGFTITGGKADGVLSVGGGVYCNGSGGTCSPQLNNLAFSGNLAVFGGGALYNGGSAGISSPTITNSTFSGNAAANGGAIYDDGSSSGTSNPSIANVTFFGNSASSCGGAIYDDASDSGTSSPIIRSATFSGNAADSANGDGSAICDFTATGSNATALTNAIVWGNSSPEISTYSGGMTLDHVVLQENACPNGVTCLTAPIGSDPHLGALQDNGGFTPTMMPGVGSSAIDAGLDGACMSQPVNALDQRGLARPLGAHCDIGAIEATRLSLSVTDGGAFGLYGKTLQYVVTLQNLSATQTVSGVELHGYGTAALDGPTTLWFCTVGNCTTTQTQGPLADIATLVPNGTLTWLVNVPVDAASAAASATMTIRSNGAGAVSDTDTLAIFRGTFEGP